MMTTWMTFLDFSRRMETACRPGIKRRLEIIFSRPKRDTCQWACDLETQPLSAAASKAGIGLKNPLWQRLCRLFRLLAVH